MSSIPYGPASSAAVARVAAGYMFVPWPGSDGGDVGSSTGWCGLTPVACEETVSTLSLAVVGTSILRHPSEPARLPLRRTAPLQEHLWYRKLG